MKSKAEKRWRKNVGIFFAVVALVAGILLPSQIRAANTYDKNKKGSVTINLDDVKVNGKLTDKKGVTVNLYQIASLSNDNLNVSFDIAGTLKSTGVDVNDITTSEKNLNSAKKLSAVIAKSGITATTKKTDSNGKVSFKDLAQGMYLVEEADGAQYGTFSPFLVAIP